jgi:hypothetical protein
LVFLALQEAGFCVPQLESVCQVQSWQGEVELPPLQDSLQETAEASGSSSSSRSAVCNQDCEPAAAPAAGQPAVPAWLQQVISQQQQQQQGQSTAAAAAAAGACRESECMLKAAEVETGDAENAQALSKLGAVRRYNCMVAEAPPALLQFLDDAEDTCIAGGAYTLHDQSPTLRSGSAALGFSPDSSCGSGFMAAGQMHARRRPRRQSYIVTDYFNFEGASSGKIARTASGFVPSAPPCTPGRPGVLFGRRTSSGIESVSSLQSQLSNISGLHSQRSNISSSTLQSSGGSLLSRRGSGADSLLSGRTSSGFDAASMRSCSGIDPVQLLRGESDASEQAGQEALGQNLAAAEGGGSTLQQQQQQMGPQRTSSGCSSTSSISSSCGGVRNAAVTSQRRVLVAFPLVTNSSPRVRLPIVASGNNLGPLTEEEAEATGSSFSHQQQQQQQQQEEGGLAGSSFTQLPQQQQQGMQSNVASNSFTQQQQQQGGPAGNSSMAAGSQFTNLWTSKGGSEKVVSVPRRTASTNVAALQLHQQQQQQQDLQEHLQEKVSRMSMGAGPVQVQLGAAAAKLLRVQSMHKPGTPALAGNSRDAPGIIAGSLTQQQAAGIHLGRLCGAGSFGRVYRCAAVCLTM